MKYSTAFQLLNSVADEVWVQAAEMLNSNQCILLNRHAKLVASEINRVSGGSGVRSCGTLCY